jgi:hypothetical protein
MGVICRSYQSVPGPDKERYLNLYYHVATTGLTDQVRLSESTLSACLPESAPGSSAKER